MRSDIVINTLRREMERTQSRISKLEKLMSESHLKSETAKKMDSFARRFNEATTAKAKMAVADEWKATSDTWKRQLAKAKKQNESYTKWMDEQSDLMGEVSKLSSEISLHEIRNNFGYSR